MKIVVKIIGGLGNQLFQYAFGRALSAANGEAPLLLDISGYKDYRVHDYALEPFKIAARFAKGPEVAELKNGAGRWLWKRKPAVFAETSFRFSADALRLKPPVYVDGYWQSEKYFAGIAAALREEFVLRDSPDRENHELLGRIRGSDSVSLHVRRGDYLSNPGALKVHGVLSLDYYRRAIDLIRSRIPRPRFFVFSDDPEWVRANLKCDHEMKFVNFNGRERCHEDLRLMSACGSHIIANSTFSWWGAWLNPSKGKTVIAPERWFRTAEMDDRDLIPDGWIRLPG